MYKNINEILKMAKELKDNNKLISQISIFYLSYKIFIKRGIVHAIKHELFASTFHHYQIPQKNRLAML